MLKAKYAAILAIAVMVVSVSVVAASGMTDGASGDYTARVFIGDGTESGTTELEGSGPDIEGILTDALSGRIVINPNGTVRSLDGVENTDAKNWYILQWRPPTGWVSVLANSSGNAYLDSGTSYYVYYSDVTTGTDGRVSYSTPSSFEPVGTAYFFIKFVTDANANDYVTSVLTEEQRLEGFWISGEGSDIAEAFINACSELRSMGNSGFQLEINDDPNNELYGWLGSFMGLEDDDSPGGGLWNNWSQFSWNDDTGRWEYNNWCLGYYDPGVYPYFSIIRQITAEDDANAQGSPGPSSIPSNLRSDSCTVRFVDGNGATIKTQSVPYFGSATAPSNPTKDPEGGVTYTFSGWDTYFGQVISDLTVTAQFTSSGTPVDPVGPDEPGDEGVAVTGVKITISVSDMKVGDSSMFRASVMPSNAENKAVVWSTSNSSVATVDGNGNVKAVSEGVAVISVITVDGGKTDTVVVNVTSSGSSISIIDSGDWLTVAGKTKPMVIAGGTGNAVFTSSNTDVAVVDASGNVTAVSPGIAKITAEFTGVVAIMNVVVSDGDGGTVEVDATEDEADGRWSSKFDAADLEGTVTTVTVDAGPMGKIELPLDVCTELAQDGELELSVQIIKDLRPGQEDVVGDNEVYEYLIYSGNASFGEAVTVKMPYTLPSGKSADEVQVYQIDSYGNILERFDCTYSEGFVTFDTTHFSMYFASTENLSAEEQEGGSDEGGSDVMLYAGIVVVIVVVVLAAVAVMRRSA